MIDATARASRFDSDPSAPAYLWAPPGKPVTVSIPLSLIDRLERDAVESFRSLTSRGSEIGGVLFGSAVAGSPTAVVIESFEPVDCDYAAGPLYRLGDAELARLDRVIEQRAAAGSHPIGFYRSHTRKGLSLDAGDLALFESRFREPHQIALVIRPAAAKASTAGIFIREEGVVHGEASCLEFPFRSAQHEAPKLPGGMYDSPVAGPRSVNAAPAPPKPAIRAQIVPIASRREVSPEPPEPVAAVPDPAPASIAPPEPAKAVEPPPAPAPEPPKAEPAPAVHVEPEPVPVKRGSSKLLWVVIGAAASVLLCVGFIFSSGVLHRGPRVVPGVNQDTSPLALRVDRNGGDIILTWNRDSDAIKKASRAVLEISDGPQHENVAMDLAQLRNGSIVYTPVTGDVVFRMEVSGADEAKTLSESVRVLRTRPSPMPDGSPAPQQAQTPGQAAPKPAAEPGQDTANASGPSAAEEPEKPVALAQAVKPFRADSLAQRLRPASPAAAPDTALPGASVPIAAPSVNLGNIVGSPAAVPTPSAPAPTPQKTFQSGGQIQQAQLLHRRDPEFPKMARESNSTGTVELIATIGVDGKVKAVQVVKGPPLLRQPAAEAVKQWIYRPTLLNGKPIESQTQILLNFKAER